MILLSGNGSLSEQLHEYVTTILPIGPGAWLVAELIARKGSQFLPAVLPATIQRGKARDCYLNATLLAQRHGFDYVEGVAIRKVLPGIAFHHAWCALPGSDQVIDNTFEDIAEDVFFGIRFSHDKLYAMMDQSGCYGYLQNAIRPNYEFILALDPTLNELWPDMQRYIK
jgi:hypothetical protein